MPEVFPWAPDFKRERTLHLGRGMGRSVSVTTIPNSHWWYERPPQLWLVEGEEVAAKPSSRNPAGAMKGSRVVGNASFHW